jgi:phosphatidylserine/phosphatidylglycerophosphate/cardiolipin synthase-like enzyme
MKRFLFLPILLSSFAFGQVSFNSAQSDISISTNGYLKSLKTISDMEFSYNLDLESYDMKNYINGLFTQSVFLFDTNKYQEMFNARDLITAKRNQYKSFNFNRLNREYVGKPKSFATWKRMVHPPVVKIKEGTSYNLKLENAYNSDLDSAKFKEHIESTYSVNVTTGNKTKILKNGDFFEDVKIQLDNASESILIANMFMKCDVLSTPIVDSIKNAIKRNVKVYMIFDGIFIKLNTPKCIKKLKRSGAQVLLMTSALKTMMREINPLTKKTARFFHSKYWIIDKRIAYVSGGNIIDAQVVGDGRNTNYRDTGVKTQGPIVNEILADYIELYTRFKKSKYLSNLELKEQDEVTGGDTCFYLHNWKRKDKNLINNFYNDLISRTQTHLYFTTLDSLGGLDSNKSDQRNKYFNNVNSLLERGITIDLHLNAHWGAWSSYEVPGTTLQVDVNPVNEILKKKFKVLEQNGVLSSREYVLSRDNTNLRGHRYFQFNHNKVMMVDGTIGVIGTHNFEQRSFFGNIENILVCSGEKFSRQMKDMLHIDLTNSYPIIKTH